mgnify:CR=1 FL=1
MNVENIKVYGLEEALANAGLPFSKGEPKEQTLIKLANSGQRSHAKFLRQIMIGFNITASGMFMKEFDTYKIGVTRMSTSTMHTLLKQPLDYDNFSFHNIYNSEYDIPIEEEFKKTLDIIFEFNKKVLKSNKSNDVKLMLIKTVLPESFNYISYITMNYEVLRTMYNDRKNHRLPEWKMFLETFDSIPYFNEFIKGE